MQLTRRTPLVRRQGATRKPCRAPSSMTSMMTARATPRIESSSRSWDLRVSSQSCTLLRLAMDTMVLATRVQQVDPLSELRWGQSSWSRWGPYR
jgi:hypothetical protein